jgi:hypothetical protein
LTPIDNPKNPPPPHEKIKNYIDFNNQVTIVRPVGAGEPKYLTPIDNPKNPPPPHEKIKNYIDFNNQARIVVRDYSLGGAGYQDYSLCGKICWRTRPYRLWVL